MATVMVVEDDEDSRELASEVLQDGGYDVAQAKNGVEALEVLSRMKYLPCLVLLDCVMPIMSGPEFMKVIRSAGHRLRTLPVVVMSGTANEGDVPGVRTFLRKPLTARTLLKVVAEFCTAPALL